MMIEVKICDNCGHRNPINVMECEQCGLDLTFAYPQMVDDSIEEPCEENETGSGVVLEYVSDPSYRINITKEISVGRDCDELSEIMNSSNYTSRVHAKLRIKDGKLQVMDASTNGTYLNDVQLKKLEWVDVNIGDKIKFADLEFVAKGVDNAD